MSSGNRLLTIPLATSSQRSQAKATRGTMPNKIGSQGHLYNRIVGWTVAVLLLFNLLLMIYRQQNVVTCERDVSSEGKLKSSQENEPMNKVTVLLPDNRDAIADQQATIRRGFEPGKQAPPQWKMDALMKLLSDYNRVGVENQISLSDMPERIPIMANTDSVYWRFNLQIGDRGLYLPATSNDGKLIDELLQTMATAKVEFLETMIDKGTELKLFARFNNGLEAVMKPKRVGREEVVSVDSFYNAERERHYAEIAAFHLDRLLGFARLPPCVGRKFNITSEIVPYVDDTLLRTVHRSPGGNLCFFGKCKYLCDLFHPACGEGDVIEHSVCVYLPVEQWPTLKRYSPWRRAYNCHKVAEWQEPARNETYCRETVLTNPAFSEGRTLLDIVDCLVFDFLTGNEDRHSYHKFIEFYNISAVVNYDNGRAFGRPYRDVMDILAPIYQCCRLRKSTYEKLKLIADNNDGIKLSELMRYSLSKDPLSKDAPILSERHLEALDRRLGLIFEVIERDCMQKLQLTLDQILVDDGF